MTAFTHGPGRGWRLALLGICLVVLAACTAGLDTQTETVPPQGREDSDDRPPIDHAAPARVETATFALG